MYSPLFHNFSVHYLATSDAASVFQILNTAANADANVKATAL